MDTQFKMTADPCTQEIVTTCILNAPREMVFNSFMEPIIIERWWGPRHLVTSVETFDPWHGGSWRFVQHDAKGNEYSFKGVFHDIVVPERIVQTFEYEGFPGHVLLDTVTFEDVNGQTRVIDHSVFQNVADRDAMLAENMEAGASESMERLGEILASMMRAPH
jgi:uncharacterized protein YndB with AHSA1/START domain